MALSEGQELEMLRLRKAKSMAQTQEPAPEDSFPEIEDTMMNQVKAGVSALGNEFVGEVGQITDKLGAREIGLWLSQAENPMEQDEMDAARKESRLAKSVKEINEYDPEYRAQKKAFPKTTAATGLAGKMIPYVANSPTSLATGSGLAARAGLGALEGAGAGYLASEEGSEGTGSTVGGIIGGSIPVVGKLLAKTGMFAGKGVAEITEEARYLMDDVKADMFIPLSQALPDDSLLKMWYRGVVANSPGASGIVRGQYDEAVKKLRTLAMHDALPDRMLTKAGEWSKFAAKTTREQFDDMHGMWSRAYNFMHDIPINPKMLPRTADDWIVKNMEPGIAGRWVKGQVSGKDFSHILTKMNKSIGGMGDDVADAEGKALIGWMDEAVEGVGKQMGKGKYKKVFDEWQALKPKYKEWMKLQRAEAKAPGVKKDFSVMNMSSAAKQVGKSSDTQFAKHAELAQTGLKDFESNPGVFQMLASLGISAPIGVAAGAGAAAVGAGAAPVAAATLATPLALNRMLASPAVQKFLVGRGGGLQPAISKIVDSALPHAKKIVAIQQLLTKAGIVGTTSEE